MWTSNALHNALQPAEFALALLRRLAEEEIVKHVITTDGSIGRSQALGLLRSWYLSMPHVKGGTTPAGLAAGVVLDLARSAADEGEARAWADDAAFLAWVEGGGGATVIAAELKVCLNWQAPLWHCSLTPRASLVGQLCISVTHVRIFPGSAATTWSAFP